MIRFVAVFLVAGMAVAQSADPGSWDVADLRVRDPFIWPDSASRTYLMFQSGDMLQSLEGLVTDSDGSYYDLIKTSEQDGFKGVVIYESGDLKTWTGPEPVLRLPASFWARYQVWAPEMHAYKGQYYLFVTLTSRDTLPRPAGRPVNYRRGTQIFVSASPRGPFHPFSNDPTTPQERMCLDGTLFLEAGVPYMVYCHEWIQITNGSIEIIPLKQDLSASSGPPVSLFSADEAAWVRCRGDLGELFEGRRYHAYVSDAPWFYRMQSGALLMLWSSYGANRYTQGMAVSRSGSVFGPWEQNPVPLYTNDGGHAMIFRTFDGRDLLVLHQPNRRVERARYFTFEETDTGIRVTGEWQP